MTIRAFGFGAGGHARAVIDALRAAGGVEVVGLLDPRPEMRGQETLGVPVLGGDEEAAALIAAGVRHAFVAIGSVGDAGARRRAFALALSLGLDLVPVIHPRAVLAPSAALGRGPCIMALAVVNAAARIGDGVILNTGSIVEHDCVIESHAHIAPGAALGGGVTVGEGAHVGLGARVRERIRIGRGALVGAGAVVVSDVAPGVVVVGVPARPIERRGG